jgi:hypothetical protein
MQKLSNEIAGKYEEIIEKIKSFSSEFLNEEYNEICVLAAETLFLNCEENLKKGKSISWAAGIVHAIGTVNNLFDSKEEPYVKATDLYKAFGVSGSTGSSKSKEVKNLLELEKENKQWIIGENNNTNLLKDNASKVKDEAAVTANNFAKVDKDIEEKEREPFKFSVHKDLLAAQAIIDYAWKQKNYNNRAKYAKEALAVWEDCADAYIILSRDSSLNAAQKKTLLERAVKAAQNSLRIDNLENAESELFKLKIAEPFFGAKYNLAMHLWENEEKEAAIENALEILKYDEQDNLVVRGIVVNWLLIEKKYSELEDLLKKYEKDDLAAIKYSKVALLYKQNKVEEAEHALRRAYRRNPYVIPYLLKQKKILSPLPSLIKIGSEIEAMKYVSLALEVWSDSEMSKWLKEKKKDFDMINFN